MPEAAGVSPKPDTSGAITPARTAQPDLIDPEQRPYDEALLEKSRTQWQFGDWQSLARLTREKVEAHPGRAKLALLVAAAHQQTDNLGEVRVWVALAQNWGCPKELVSRVLIAGVYQTLGRAALIAQDEDKAERWLSQSVSTGMPGSEARLWLAARRDSAMKQVAADDQRVRSQTIDKKLGRSTKKSQGHFGLNKLDKQLDSYPSNGEKGFIEPCEKEDFNQLNLIYSSAFSGNRMFKWDHDRVINWIRGELLSRGLADDLNEFGVKQFAYRERDIDLAYLKGDYIPEKIFSEASFYEAELLGVLEMFCSSGDTVLDIGANIGNHSIYLATYAGAYVLSFEPEPHNYLCMTANVFLNEVSDHVVVYPFGLSDVNEVLPLTMTVEKNFGSWSAQKNANPNRNIDNTNDFFAAEFKKLDDIYPDLPSLGRLALVKIDVEGMEMEVLKGALQTLEVNVPVIVVECFTQEKFLEIEGFLAEFGYKPVSVHNYTPTFLFVNSNDSIGKDRLDRYLRSRALDQASRSKGFLQ